MTIGETSVAKRNWVVASRNSLFERKKKEKGSLIYKVDLLPFYGQHEIFSRPTEKISRLVTVSVAFSGLTQAHSLFLTRRQFFFLSLRVRNLPLITVQFVKFQSRFNFVIIEIYVRLNSVQLLAVDVRNIDGKKSPEKWGEYISRRTIFAG